MDVYHLIDVMYVLLIVMSLSDVNLSDILFGVWYSGRAIICYLVIPYIVYIDHMCNLLPSHSSRLPWDCYNICFILITEQFLSNKSSERQDNCICLSHH